jgi:hypothetical protein
MTFNSRLTKKKDIFTPITLIEPDWLYLFLNTHVAIPKNKKKTKLKHHWLGCSLNIHAAKPKNKKDKLTKSKQHGKNNRQTKINMYKI